MTKEERYDIFERYLRGTLNGLEQKELEGNLDSDPSLRKELELHRGLHQAIGDKKLRYFTELVQESETAYFKEKSKNTFSIFQRYGKRIAAFAAILIVGLISYFFFFPKPSPEQLFATHFEPYQAPGTFRSEDLATLDNDFILALARYDEGQYGEASAFFSKTLDKNPDKSVAVFLRGISYLAVDSLALAKRDFKSVIADEESLFGEQARWYLGLLYLKQGDRENAQKIWLPIQSKEEVKVLLQKIGK